MTDTTMLIAAAQGDAKVFKTRAEAAEARVAQLEAALMAFDKHFGPLEDNEMVHPDARRCFQLARAALQQESSDG